jgi:von Willebrand factor
MVSFSTMIIDKNLIFLHCSTCKSGKWSCSTLKCAATCTAWGDSHFETFDGKDYDFQGVCTYILSKGTLPDGNSYSVTIQNVLCGSFGVTCTKSVEIKLMGQNPQTVKLTEDTYKANLNQIESNGKFTNS